MMMIDWQRYYELEKRDYNTLTEEEIAVATAKGWSVSLV